MSVRHTSVPDCGGKPCGVQWQSCGQTSSTPVLNQSLLSPHIWRWHITMSKTPSGCLPACQACTTAVDCRRLVNALVGARLLELTAGLSRSFARQYT